MVDVFALRLKLRGPIKPLVAYQMRPNPDIPKDRNLVSFKINPTYTKQSCLDGRLGLEADASYPMAGQDGPPRDVSYFKPGEAYALKDRIRRAEEQLAASMSAMISPGSTTPFPLLPVLSTRASWAGRTVRNMSDYKPLPPKTTPHPRISTRDPLFPSIFTQGMKTTVRCPRRLSSSKRP